MNRRQLTIWALAVILCSVAIFTIAGRDASLETGIASEVSTRMPQLKNHFRLLFTGNTLGYIEACDCSGGRLGGLDRRSAAIKENISSRWPTILIDLGNLYEIPTGGPMTELGRRQARFLTDEMERMGYEFLTLGSRDLAFGSEFLEEFLPEFKHPPLLTNRAPDTDFGVETIPLIRLELAELKVDFFNVVDPDLFARGGILTRWEDVLRRHLFISSNGENPADVQVVIAHVPFQVAEAMPGWFPEIDIILNGAMMIPRQAWRIEKCVTMTVAGKGQHLAQLDVTAVPKEMQMANSAVISGFQGLIIPLPPDYMGDREVRRRMDTFKARLIKDGLILP